MSERESPREIDEMDSGEFEIEAEEEGDIEAAMRDALKAVESVSTEARSQPRVSSEIGPEGDEIGEEVAELRDRLTRTLADFDNFRKRVEKEWNEERQYATSEVFRQLLPVIDNLERALSAQGSEQDLKRGVELILRQVKELLSSSGVERVTAAGEEFDPRFHEAVSQYEDPSVEIPTVSEELQSGFTMHGRLLRPSVVRVAMPASNDAADAETTESD